MDVDLPQTGHDGPSNGHLTQVNGVNRRAGRLGSGPKKAGWILDQSRGSKL